MKIELKNHITLNVPEEIQAYTASLSKATEIICDEFEISSVDISLIFIRNKKQKNNRKLLAGIQADGGNKYTLTFNVQGLTYSDFTSLFFHEMKHLAQLNSKELVEKESGHEWKGEFYDLSKELSYEEYRALPWEVEAHNAEYKWPLIHGVLKSSMITTIKKLVTFDNQMVS